MKTIQIEYLEDLLVSYETAKLLKDVNFNIQTQHFYNPEGHVEKVKDGVELQINSVVYAPMQETVFHWLERNFQYYVYVKKTKYGDYAPFITDEYGVELFNPWENDNMLISYTLKEAKEDAIMYILKKLILQDKRLCKRF